MKQNHYDCIIIGAGMSGLAAGIRLAYYEKKVCILEKHVMPGGLNSFYRLGGRNFDVGLHAMTNYVPRDVRGAPLNKLLRQLRIKYDEFGLVPQQQSEIKFPEKTLCFSNEFALFEADVCEKFPDQADRFRRFVKHMTEYNEVALDAREQSAREVLAEFLSDPLLIEMIFCPLMFYGSAQVDDMDFSQFVIMFKSIFIEGFARPRAGVRQIISTLIKKYKACHGELRMGCGVKKLTGDGGRIAAVELDSGEILTADRVISSAGSVETEALCSGHGSDHLYKTEQAAGEMTFVESISVLDRLPSEIGYRSTITFFNNSDRFRYRPSEGWSDTESAVVCCPNNFKYDEPLDEGIMRVTNISNCRAWDGLPEEEYQARKKACYERSIAAAVKFVPDFRPYVKFIDVFTPRTIRKFTSHLNGAVYGSPEKSRTGRTRYSNLFLCGTDQGFLGIIGAMLSGISMANLHVLQGGSAKLD